jgi:hypothetical protein
LLSIAVSFVVILKLRVLACYRAKAQNQNKKVQTKMSDLRFFMFVVCLALANCCIAWAITVKIVINVVKQDNAQDIPR